MPFAAVDKKRKLLETTFPPGSCVECIRMAALAKLLLRERWRELRLHGGWLGRTGAGLVFILLSGSLLHHAAIYMKQASAGQSAVFLTSLWMVWVLFAALTGKDLSWRINRKRLRILPSCGFNRLYALTFLLGFFSFPLLFSLFVVQFWMEVKTGFSISGFLTAAAGHFFFAATVLLSASMFRLAVCGCKLQQRSSKAVFAIALIGIGGSILMSMAYSNARMLHPGYLLSLLISGEACLIPLACLGAWFLFLFMVDIRIQWDITYSGLRHPHAPESCVLSKRSFLLFHPKWPSPIFRIGILGWLRSRSALWLFIWGTAFSFLWTYYSKPGDGYYFFAFIWMNLLFHSYLRGNLLGVDRGAAWIYYMFPCRIEYSLSSKSWSLSLLQAIMIASLMAAGLLQVHSVIDPAAWGWIASYAVSAILCGEILGLFLSIKFPEAVDWTSQFDGGMTVGALIVPVIHIVFLLLFIPATAYLRQIHTASMYWTCLLFVPLLLLIARSGVLKSRIHAAMLRDMEMILKKLEG